MLKLLGLLYRRFYGLVDSSCTIELYKTLIRPHLEYATPVWAPYLTKSIVNLVNFQTFALKFCFNSWTLNITIFCFNLPIFHRLNLEGNISLFTRFTTVNSGFLAPYHGCSNHASSHSINHTHAKMNAYYFTFFQAQLEFRTNCLTGVILTPSLYSKITSLYLCYPLLRYLQNPIIQLVRARTKKVAKI